jgi:hypothetical protein
LGGGKILLTTPNRTFYGKNIVWETDRPPVHLWWFSEDSMKHIADKLNANVQFTDFTDYYKKRPTFIDIKTQRNIPKQHIFNKDGEIIKQIDDNAKAWSWYKRLRFFVAKLFVAKYLYYYKIKRHYKCGRKGWVLGVELKNKTAENGY